MAIVATALIPSSTNTKGGLAGVITTIACGYLAKAGYFAVAAAAIGQPEVMVAALAAGIIGVGTKMLITHVSELKEVDDFVVGLQSIKTEASYPHDPQPPSNVSNINQG